MAYDTVQSMEIPDILRMSYVMDFLFMMESGPMLENDFRAIRNSYYQNRDTLNAMADAGLIRRIDDGKQRGRRFELTEKGRKVIEGFEVVCDAMMSRSRHRTSRRNRCP